MFQLTSADAERIAGRPLSEDEQKAMAEWFRNSELLEAFIREQTTERWADEEGNAEVPEIPADEFRIMLFSENTVLWLTGMASYDLEAAGEIIIPALDPAL